jgi:hypothetical protein
VLSDLIGSNLKRRGPRAFAIAPEALQALSLQAWSYGLEERSPQLLQVLRALQFQRSMVFCKRSLFVIDLCLSPICVCRRYVPQLVKASTHKPCSKAEIATRFHRDLYRRDFRWGRSPDSECGDSEATKSKALSPAIRRLSERVCRRKYC